MQHKHPSCTVVSTERQKLGGQLAIHGTTICIEKPVLGVHVRSDYANPDEKVPQNGYKTCWPRGSWIQKWYFLHGSQNNHKWNKTNFGMSPSCFFQKHGASPLLYPLDFSSYQVSTKPFRQSWIYKASFLWPKLAMERETTLLSRQALNLNTLNIKIYPHITSNVINIY